MTKLLITALALEARPFIDRLKLKKDPASRRIPVYRLEETSLAISGTGKLNAAVATTWLLAREPEPADCLMVNFGICGCVDLTAPIGRLFRIHHIRDAGTGRDFFPEMLIRDEVAEASLMTADHPVTRTGYTGPPMGMVDMEGSGFFTAASRFLPPERVVLLKMVSDYLEPGKIEPERLAPLISAAATLAVTSVTAHARALPQLSSISKAEEAILHDIHARLRLTATQRNQLRDLARGYRLRHPGGLQSLKRPLPDGAHDRKARDRCFAELKHALME